MNMASIEALATVRRRLAAEIGGTGRLGVQLYVSSRGEPVCSVAMGQYRPGEALTPDHLLPWLCSGKPVTVIALGQLYDRSLLSTTMRVADVIPEFAAGGKQDVTLHHLLTHSVVFVPGQDMPWQLDWDAAVACVCNWSIEAPPGERVSYSAFASWLILGEVVQRVSGMDYYQYVRQHVLEPLDMHACTFFQASGDTPPQNVLVERSEAGELLPLNPSWFSPDDARTWPGTGMWGPVHELAHPLECVVAGGVRRGHRLLSPQAIEHFFTPARSGIGDEKFAGLDLSWGRGVCTDPAWFGAPANTRVAGHSGHLTSLVVGDLDAGLVVACVTNTVVAGEPMLRRFENLVVQDVYHLMGK